MNVSDFEYDLPPELVAQEPAERRDAARLLWVERSGERLAHHRFGELAALVRAGDVLVLNDTRVIPARLMGRKVSGGRLEVLLVEREGGTDREPEWRCLVRASRAPRPRTRVRFGATLSAEVLRRDGDGFRLRFEGGGETTSAALERLGRMPLPPYISREESDPRDERDRRRYQTVYARRAGAVAAPTAGLHFTRPLLEGLRRRGVTLASLTLHVGPGTFQPVRVERVEDHVMHEEWFELPAATARAIDAARRRGGRVIAVGTTVVRVLEHCAGPGGGVEPARGRSGLFIYPGYRFRVVDAMITNFHLPRSTLLMLVCAFAGRETIRAAYAEAVRERYRFYSYGDAMMIGSSR